jgi:hypothetical protein
MYNIKKCTVKQVWCGKSNVVPDPEKYYKVGNKEECFKRGFGSGHYSEVNKTLPQNSLMRIPYVGEVMEQNFKNNGIQTLSKLVSKTKNMTSEQKDALLKKVLKNKDGKINTRAYNSVIIFLFNKGILSLPPCKTIKYK